MTITEESKRNAKKTLNQAWDELLDNKINEALDLIMTSADIANNTTLFNDILSVDQLGEEGTTLVDEDYEPFDTAKANEKYYYVSNNGVDELRVVHVDKKSLMLTVDEALKNL